MESEDALPWDLFTSATEMLKQLRAARADGSYDRRLARCTGVDVLVLDDLGLKPLGADEAADLYEVIRLRYQRGALILTSNRDAEELGSLFGVTIDMDARMRELLTRFKLPTLGPDVVRRFTDAGHHTARTTLLEVLEAEADEARTATH
jgi:hypothetical protein